jgi:hypothetical protein
MTTDDEKLKDEFTRLRKLDARRAPSFESLRTRSIVRPLRPAVLAAVPLLAAAAALVLVWRGAQPVPQAASPTFGVSASAPPSVALAAQGEEPLPLDFLLQTHVVSTDLQGSVASARGSFDSDFLLRAPTNLRGHTP